MPFSWLDPPVPEAAQATLRSKALSMYREEIRRRASLLMQLGYSQKEAARRCKENLRWDFELSGSSPVEGEVDKLVQAVYRRK